MLNLSVRSSSTTSSVPFEDALVELSPFAIPFLQREIEEHGGAAAFLAVHRERAAVLLHDGLRNAEPQAGARGLRGEERVEQLRQRPARDAHAGVDDAHLLALDPGRVRGRGTVAGAVRVAARVLGAPPRPA